MLLSVFANNVLPPLLVVAAGYALEKAIGLDLRTLSRVAIYVFTPALVIGSLIDTQVTGSEVTQLLAFALAFSAVMGAVAFGVARLLGLDERRTNAFLLSTLFNNCGNYGLAVLLFAYGQAGLERGLVFFLVNSLLIHTVAIYFASRGAFDARQSVGNVFRVPMIYAVAVALVVRALHIGIPAPLMRAIDLPRVGAIPLMQLLLGAQLARTSRHADLRFVAGATTMRLLGGAAIGLGLSAFMGLQGLARSASVLQASMPSAVSVVAFSIEFGGGSEEIGSVVLASTLASAVTLTLLITLLQ